MTKYKVSIEITVETPEATFDPYDKSDREKAQAILAGRDWNQDVQRTILSLLDLTRAKLDAFNKTHDARSMIKIIGYSVHTKQCQKPLEVKL